MRRLGASTQHIVRVAQTKKGQLALPFSRIPPAKSSYFFDENAANFLLNFSTRPAVSMIFC